MEEFQPCNGGIPLELRGFEIGNFQIQVLEAEPRRISKIRLQIS